MHGSIADPFKSATGVVTGRDYRTAAALATLTGDLYLAPNLDTLLAQAVRFVSVAITCDCAAVVLWPSHGAERWLVAGSDRGLSERSTSSGHLATARAGRGPSR